MKRFLWNRWLELTCVWLCIRMHFWMFVIEAKIHWVISKGLIKALWNKEK